MKVNNSSSILEPSLWQIIKIYRIHLLIMVLAAFGLRALVFTVYMGQSERYRQPDSGDYHVYALSLLQGKGMANPATGEPAFWRTPGYPWFLKSVYEQYVTSGALAVMHAQRGALWLQILLCSLLPLFMFMLAYILTSSTLIALSASWISVVHVGFVLTSTHLQTDGLALIFFVPFLCCFYRSFSFSSYEQSPRTWIVSLVGAALLLGLYTWIRPMGLFVAQLSAIILICSHDALKPKLQKIALFLSLFFVCIGGWYLRNYRLTGQLFYNPTFGPTLGMFCAPKIIRAVTGKPLDQSLQIVMQNVNRKMHEAEHIRQLTCSPYVVVRENCITPVVTPLLMEHPFLFMRDWFMQVIKTSFDLYSSMLVACVKNTQWYDDLEDFLTVKVSECLGTYPVPLAIRMTAWLEFLFLLAMWGGFFVGCVIFLVLPLCGVIYDTAYTQRMIPLWLKTGIMAGGILAMTGAFGYARLRLPVDVLVIILSLTFWAWLIRSRGISRELA